MKPEQFIREQGLPEAKRILEMAPEDATHYRDLSCGTRYTKNVSETECYVWTNKHWRRSVVPYQIFTSEVIKPLSELKHLVESLDVLTKLGGIHIVKEWFKKNGNAPLHQKYLAFSGLSRIDCFSTDHYGAVHASRVKKAIRDHESIYGGGESA